MDGLAGEGSVHGVDHERGHRGHQSADGDQHLVKRVLAGQFVVAFRLVPQPAAAPPDVPVGEVVHDKILEVSAGFVVVPCDEPVVVLLSHRMKFGKNPTIQGGPLVNG